LTPQRHFQRRFLNAKKAHPYPIESKTFALGEIEAGIRKLRKGDGRLTFCYAPGARCILAIDPRVEAVAKACNALPTGLADRVRFELGSALELDQPSASFEVTLLLHSL
jgi:hypothetical protein